MDVTKGIKIWYFFINYLFNIAKYNKKVDQIFILFSDIVSVILYAHIL